MSGLCDSNVHHEIQYYTSANLCPLFYIHPGIGIIFRVLGLFLQYSRLNNTLCLATIIIKVNMSRYKYSSVTSVTY